MAIENFYRMTNYINRMQYDKSWLQKLYDIDMTMVAIAVAPPLELLLFRPYM